MDEVGKIDRDFSAILTRTKKIMRDKEDIEPARVKCVVIHETEKAILIRQGLTDYWIPRAACSHILKLGFNKHNPRHKDATIEMPEWLADEKGLDYE